MALAIGKGGELNVVLRVKDDGSVTVEKFGRTAEQSFSKGANAAKAMGSAYEYASGNLSALSRNIFSLKGAIAGLGVGAVAKQFIDAASSAEQYRVRLNVLLGSVSEGSRLFAEMSKYANRTPFEYQEIMGAAIALSGVLKGGVDEITKWMPLIGDLAAVSGLSIQETTGQVSRMLSAGAAAADMFRERGILAMLGFQAGVQISAEETKTKLLAAWTDTNSRFRGATEQLAGTWEGTMSMLADKWFIFRNQVMDAGLFDFIKAGARVIDADLGGAMEGNKEAAKRWADAIISDIQTMTLGVAKFVDVMDGPARMIGSIASNAWDQYQKLPSWAQDIGILGALMLGPKGRLALIGTLAALDNLDISKFEGVVTADKFIKGTPEELRGKLDQVNANLKIWREKESRAWWDWKNTLPDATAVMPSQEDLEQLKVQLLTALQAAGQGAEKLPKLPNLTDQLLGEGNGKKDGGSAVDRVTTFFDQVRAEMDKARAAAGAAVANDTGGNAGAGADSNSPGSGLIVGNIENDLQTLRGGLAEKLSILDESYLGEADLLYNKYTQEELLLEQSNEMKVISDQEYLEKRLRLEDRYQAEKAKLNKKDEKDTRTHEQILQDLKVAAHNRGVQLLDLLAMRYQKVALAMLIYEKAKAIASVIMDTRAGAMKAVGQLGIYAGPAVAAIYAMGAANVALIAATGIMEAKNITGGQSASPVYSANPGTSNPTTDSVSPIDNNPATSNSSAHRTVYITIDSSSMLTSTWVRDQLIPEINSAIGDGVELKVSV